MKKLILFAILLLITICSFSQTNEPKSKILTGEFTIPTKFLNDLKDGDTLLLIFAKEPFFGMLKIDRDKVLYERSRAEETGLKKKGNEIAWNKIGFWEIDGEEVVFNLATRLITFKYLPLEPYSDKQFLIVTSIMSM